MQIESFKGALHFTLRSIGPLPRKALSAILLIAELFLRVEPSSLGHEEKEELNILMASIRVSLCMLNPRD